MLPFQYFHPHLIGGIFLPPPSAVSFSNSEMVEAVNDKGNGKAVPMAAESIFCVASSFLS